MNPNMATPNSEEKFQMHVDNDVTDANRLVKSRYLIERRQFRWTSLILPLLLGLLLLIGTVLLILTVTRQNTCRRQQTEQAEAILGYIPDEHTRTWTPCLKTSTSSCACPASFTHSKSNPSHCIPNHSRCLKSCKNNLHCTCHNLHDPTRCRQVTRTWIDYELKIGSLERYRKPTAHHLLQHTWMEHFNQQLEHLLVDVRSGEQLFLSADRHTGIAIHKKDDDYLLNERWTKFDVNTTRQRIVYTQLSPQSHTCRMSLLRDDASVTHGPIHSCPGTPMGAPYFLGAACNDVLVLWHGGRQLKIRRQEGWTTTRHHFESVIPRLPVLFDPFHRYYSLYEDLMIEVKDLNGDVLGQFFTDVIKPNRFEFVDELGTMLVANTTHMQVFRSSNKEAWLEF